MRKKLVLLLVVTLLCTSLFAQKDVFDISRSGTVEELEQLYKETPEIINTKNEVGYTPLVLACYSGNEAVVSFLVDKVDNIDGTSTYGTPLMAAVFKGYIKIVSILLKYGANPNMADDKGTTAAHYAVMLKNYNMVEQLVRAKANFDLKDNADKSALDYAKSFNDEKLNKILQL